MASREFEKYYDFIEEVTREAGKIVIEGFYGAKKVETKGGKSYDLVTDYDRKVEDFFITKIKTKYPDHLILGEESLPEGEKPNLTDSETWIIDPIDGTMNFVRGIPLIAISVAFSIKKEIVLGIVYNPIINQFFSAIQGKGAYCNGKKIYSSNREDLKEAIISNEVNLISIPFLRERTFERLHKITEKSVFGIRCFGSVALTLCYVANGSLDVYFTDGFQCWDVAAGVLILKEAGGCVSNPDGKDFDMFSRIFLTAGNKVLLQKTATILKECDDKTSKTK